MKRDVALMSNFLTLSRGMSRYNGGEYDGYVIVKLEWQITGNVVDADSKIVRERSGYCQIKSIGVDNGEETGYLTMTLLGGKMDDNAVVGTSIPTDVSDLAELSFSQEEVLVYLDAVQDTNPIHKGAGAIVPGGMVLATLQDKLAETMPWFKDANAKFTAQFLAPIDVGETFTIAQSKNGLCVYTKRLGECIRISKKC